MREVENEKEKRAVVAADRWAVECVLLTVDQIWLPHTVRHTSFRAHSTAITLQQPGPVYYPRTSLLGMQPPSITVNGDMPTLVASAMPLKFSTSADLFGNICNCMCLENTLTRHFLGSCPISAVMTFPF